MASVNYQSYYQPQPSYHHQLPHSYAPSAPPMEEEEPGCPICLDPHDSDTVVTKCNHLFHNACLKQHMNHGVNSNCPMCRSPLVDRDIKPISSPVLLEPIYQPKTVVQAKASIPQTQEDDCSICCEPVGVKVPDSVVTKCHHLFHDGCLKAWLDTSAHKDCPNCRTPLQQRDIKPLVVPAVEQPKPQAQGPSAASAVAGAMWSGVKWGGSALWATGKGSLWLTGKVASGLFNGTSYLVKLAASKRPLTATEQLGVNANEKLGKLYASKIHKLELALTQQLSQVELSIAMADSVYDPSLHTSFVRALKELAERVNEQFDFFQIGQKNFYDEGLNYFSEVVTNLNSSMHHPQDWDSRKKVSFTGSTQKAVQLPNKMNDEFVVVSKAIKAAYTTKIQQLKSQLEKQYEDTQLEISKKVSILDPADVRRLRHGLNHLIKKTEEEFTWLMTGVDNFNKEGLQNFNKTIRYL